MTLQRNTIRFGTLSIVMPPAPTLFDTLDPIEVPLTPDRRIDTTGFHTSIINDCIREES